MTEALVDKLVLLLGAYFYLIIKLKHIIIMVAFIVLLGIVFGGVKLLAVANNISDNEAMDKYSGKLFVIGIIIFAILMCVIGNNDDGFN